MGFVTVMRSSVGRLLRIAMGGLMMWYGLAHMAGTGGVLLAAFGVVPILAGIVNFCLLGPVFGLTLMGRPATLRS
jgi:hypothetical protein